MNEEDVYRYIEPFILSLYLIFIFISIQIWFLWKDIDKKEIKLAWFLNDSFFLKNCIYIYSFSIFFFVQGFSDAIASPRIYLKTLETLTLVSLVLFTYDWYSLLEPCACKRSLPQELIDFRLFIKKH